MTFGKIFAILNEDENDTNHDHAVTAMGSNSYTYDANGNQITRNISGSAYSLAYDAENRTKNVQVTRLVSVSGAISASFVYDGDGNRVKGTVNSTTIAYLGEYFEWTGSTSTMNVRSQYYFAGSTRVAMRTGSTLRFLLGDHSLVPRDRLGSTSITTNSSGSFDAEQRYYPWGTIRYCAGSFPTNYQFTDQRVESYLGYYFYNSRWYDREAGRFMQADIVIPSEGSNYSNLIVDYHETQFLDQLNQENRQRLENPQAESSPIPTNTRLYDRYAYATNNPVRYNDPTGHRNCEEDGYNCPNDNLPTSTTEAPEIAPTSTNIGSIEINTNPPFDAGLGGNNPIKQSEDSVSSKSPNYVKVVAGAGLIFLTESVGVGLSLAAGIGAAPLGPEAAIPAFFTVYMGYHEVTYPAFFLGFYLIYTGLNP